MCDQRHSPARALLPRRVSGRLHDHLTHDSPTRMVGVAASDEKPRQRLRDTDRTRLGPVAIKMAQRSPNTTATVNRTGELTRSSPRLA